MSWDRINAAAEVLAAAIAEHYWPEIDTEPFAADLAPIILDLLGDLLNERVLGKLFVRWQKGAMGLDDYDAVLSEAEAEASRRVEAITRDGVCPDCGKRAEISHVCLQGRRVS